MKLNDEATDILLKFGFTQLESDIYTYLLTHGATTGYGVAKGVSKPAANVYKAIESLANKGAIEQTSGEKKKCVAIPWEQLISSQKKQFKSDILTLENSFRDLPTLVTDEDVYQVKNITQLKDSCEELINNSQHILLADIEPDVVELLEKPLLAAAERGVEVLVKVYENVHLPGVKVILKQDGKQVYGKTEDRQLSLCSDGKETIIAMFTPDLSQVIQAFKTKSALMSLTVYNKLLYEFVLTQLKEAIPVGDILRAQKILKETEYLHPFSAENAIFNNYKNKYSPK